MNDPLENPERVKKPRSPRKGVKSSANKKEDKPVLEPPPTYIPETLPDYDVHEAKPTTHERVREGFRDVRLQLVATLLILALIGWFVVPPSYRHLKTKRANDLLDKSSLEVEAGNPQAAMALMRQAILLVPSDQSIYRRVRILNANMGEPSSLTAIQNLMMENQATTEELIILAEQSLKTKKPAITRACLEKLKDDHSARKTILDMQVLDLDGNRAMAIELARKALPKVSSKDADKILLATAEMVLKSDIPASQQILLPLIKKKDGTGMAALRLISSQKLSFPDKLSIKGSEIARLIDAHPMRSADDMLLCADLRIAESPDQKKKVIAELAATRAQASSGDALAFARWLNRRFAYKEAIDFIGKDRAFADPNWLLIYLDAHAGLNKWDEVFNLLDADTIVGLAESIRLLFLARAADKSGDKLKSDELWRDMQRNLMYENPEVVSFIAIYAMRIGESEHAIKAFWTLARRKDTALEGFLGLIRFWPQNAPVEELMPIYEEFIQTFPNLLEARIDYLYLQMLTDKNLMDASGAALIVYRNNPTLLASLSVAAFGLYKTGDFRGADSLYAGKDINWASAPMPWRAVRAAVLHAAGKKDEAKAMAAMIDKSKLRPSELKILPL
jgi:hypothetical protein